MGKNLCIICLCLFTLQGCLILRLEESKNQLCQEPARIYPIITDTITIVFETPILFPEDIVTILDARPSDEKNSGDSLIYYYSLANKKETSTRFYIPITLEFIQDKKKYRLIKAVVEKNIQTLLPKKLIQQLFAATCTAERDTNKVIVSLEKIDPSLLPKRDKLLALMGTPTSDSDDTITFLYCLNNDDNTANISIHFDSQNGKMREVDLIFFRYHLVVDWNENKAFGSFKSWQTLLGLGLRTAFSF